MDGIVVGCLYLPNGNPAPGPKFDYKLRWFDRLISYGQLLLREGKPDNVHLVKEGLGCRYTLLENGNRSVTALLLPGDFCNLHVAILGQMDHGIANVGVVSHCENSPDNDRRLDQQPADCPSSMVVDSG